MRFLQVFLQLVYLLQVDLSLSVQGFLHIWVAFLNKLPDLRMVFRYLVFNKNLLHFLFYGSILSVGYLNAKGLNHTVWHFSLRFLPQLSLLKS